jgi:hypothetical protein
MALHEVRVRGLPDPRVISFPPMTDQMAEERPQAP